MKNLVLNSLFAFLFTCTLFSAQAQNKETTLSENKFPSVFIGDSARLYKCQIHVFGKYYSGLLMSKKTSIDTTRLVFVTELGMRMFEMAVVKNEILPLYFFEPLNKEKYKTILQQDLGAIFMLAAQTPPVEIITKENKSIIKKKISNKLFYVLKLENEKPKRAELKKRVGKKLIVNYSHSENQKYFSRAYLKHKGFLRVKIILDSIRKTAQ